MKKYLLILVIALAVILAVPMMVSAQSASTVTVDGTLGTVINVDVSTPTLTFPADTFVAGSTSQAGPVTVTASANTPWTVTAQDNDYYSPYYSDSGYMVAEQVAGVTYSPLSNPIKMCTQMTVTPFSWNNQTIESPVSNFLTGGVTTIGTQDVYFTQAITSNDESGIYYIETEFIGSSTVSPP